MKNSNTFIWVLLVAITLASVSTIGKSFAFYFILSMALVKIILVAYHFMELKRAHRFWISSISLLFAFIICAIFIQYR
ncbi:MAG TPA: cytochrome C oxidase subunit IV family protein [Chitinophagales bacterium]|nr:cytochrome C oxidase subunit IV family protein [Chitinophagales bacterium]HNM31815.1 cytochrome C oxidase subunit IV family protein [Chitinophagales bacterium]